MDMDKLDQIPSTWAKVVRQHKTHFVFPVYQQGMPVTRLLAPKSIIVPIKESSPDISTETVQEGDMYSRLLCTGVNSVDPCRP